MIISKLETRVRTAKRRRTHAEYPVRKLGLLSTERKFHLLKVKVVHWPSGDRWALNLASLGAMVRCRQWKCQRRKSTWAIQVPASRLTDN